MSDYSLLKFGATWCQPCKVLDPKLSKLMGEFPNVEFFKVDIDDDKDAVKKYKITSVPTVILLDGEKEINRMSGVTLITPLRSALNDLVKV